MALPSWAEMPAGLWLMPRKDACNTARADIAGTMKTAPKEVWSYGTPPTAYSYLKPITIQGKQVFLAQVRHGVRLIRPDGSTIWNRPTMGITAVVGFTDFGDARSPVALLLIGNDTLMFLDAATGKTLWAWVVPAEAYLGGYRLLDQGRSVRLVIFPQNSMLGFCYELTAARPVPRLLWRKDYTGRYWQNFGPYFVFADMDNDGRQEIVLAGKPGYMGVIDLNTGGIKFDLQYDVAGGDHIGRPYGFLCAEDIDGDGFRDAVMVSCQVEHYISVLKNNGGKSFSLAWSQFVANDLPLGDKELRPNTTSLADVNGDGRKELVAGAFNLDGDNRWHTIVFDPMTGTRLADLPDRYFWGCYDLDGDGRPEIITSTEKGRHYSMPATLQAVDGKTARDIVQLDQASLVFMGGKLPDNSGFFAVRNTPLYTAGGLLISRGESESIWRLVDGKPSFKPFRISATSRTVLNSQGPDPTVPTNLEIKGTTPGLAASWPLVSVADGRRELVMSTSDGRIIGGTPDLRSPGVLKDTWTVQGSNPSIWTGPDGRRMVCAYGSGDNEVNIYQPAAGQHDPQPVACIKTPMTVFKPNVSRSTADLLPFGDKEMRLFVGMRPAPHNVACAVYDAKGTLLWSDPLNGPYPRVAAAADLNGDGKDEVFVDNHGKDLIYDPQGNARMIAQGWNNTVPGRGDGSKYAVPIVGPFGPKGEGRIVLSPGLDCLETLDYTGARIAKEDFPGTYDYEWCGSAVARIRGGGAWDVGMVTRTGIFHCADVETCKTRWTLNLGCKSTSAINVSSADVDGDGRDNFLVGLPNGELLALDEKNGKGFVMWKVTFDAGVDEAFLADVNGDGRGEIIVQLDDGQVKILAGR